MRNKKKKLDCSKFDAGGPEKLLINFVIDYSVGNCKVVK